MRRVKNVVLEDTFHISKMSPKVEEEGALLCVLYFLTAVRNVLHLLDVQGIASPVR